MPRDPSTHVGATVKIDGVEIPCDPTSLNPGVLSGLKITWGREDRLARPAASTCDFQLVDPDGGDDYTDVIAYGSTVEVLGITPGGSRFRVFYGRVTDLKLIHETGPDAILSVTAVDPTADMSSIMVGDTPWPAQRSNDRRSAILKAIGGASVFYWQPFEAELALDEFPPSAYPMAAQDVDNQPAWGIISDFLWGIACIPWPIAYGSTGRPGIIVTGQGRSRERQLGVYDTRDTSTEPVADFLTRQVGGVQYEIPTVCLDACDIDLDGTEFATNPNDTSKVVRLTYGTDDDSSVYVYAPTTRDHNRTFEVDSGLNSKANTFPPIEQWVQVLADRWYDQMNQWWQDFSAPWAVEIIRIDPDTVTGITDFDLAMRRLLDQTNRINHNLLLQHLPRWTPWRGGNNRYPNVIGLLQGGTYTYDDGRWLLELSVTVERRLMSDLAPAPTLVVHPGDIVDYPHDTTTVTLVPDPDTTWAPVETATFTDGPYGWDGTQWVPGGVQYVTVHPGDTVDVAHDDPRVQPDPATPWVPGEYATFTDGPYRWDGTDWLTMVTVRAGDTVALPHDAPSVLPSPAADWNTRQYATFTDGAYHWHGTGWLAMVTVHPDDVVDIPSLSHNVLADPTSAWGLRVYATFSNAKAQWAGSTWASMVDVRPGTTTIYPVTSTRLLPVPETPWTAKQYATLAGDRYQWDGDDWIAWPPAVTVAPGDSPDLAHDASGITPDPTTPWTAGQYATFTDGPYRWDGAAWTAVTIVHPGDTVPLAHDDLAAAPDPTTAWGEDDYATFTDGPYRWDGTSWVTYVAPIVVSPGATVDAAHDDPAVVAEPQTAWGEDDYATFTDGPYRWDGAAWTAYVLWTIKVINLATNPHAASDAGWSWRMGTGGAAALTTETGTDTPDGRPGYRRAVITTPDTGGYAGHQYDEVGETGAAGEVLTLSMFVRTSAEGREYRLNASTRVGAYTGDTGASDFVSLPVNTWTRMVATVTTTQAYEGLRVIVQELAAGPDAGVTVDATAVLLVRADDVLCEYFDGDTPDTDTERYDWTGTPGASTSTLSVPGATSGE